MRNIYISFLIVGMFKSVSSVFKSKSVSALPANCDASKAKNAKVDKSYVGQKVIVEFTHNGTTYGNSEDLKGTITGSSDIPESIKLDNPISISELKLSDICINIINKEYLPVPSELSFDEFTTMSAKLGDKVILIMNFNPDIKSDQTLQAKLDWLKARNGQTLTITKQSGNDIGTMSLKDEKGYEMNDFRTLLSNRDGNYTLFIDAIGAKDLLSEIKYAFKLVKPKQARGGGKKSKKSRRTNKKSKKSRKTKSKRT